MCIGRSPPIGNFLAFERPLWPSYGWSVGMRRRAFINIVAAFSLLVHAGFVARHNFLTLTQKVEAQWLLPDGTVICHSGGENQSPKSRDPLSNHPPNPHKTTRPLRLGRGPLLPPLPHPPPSPPP